MDSVNSLHYYHEVFQSRFKKLDEKYTQVMADVKNGGNSPRELPDVMISLLWLHEEFTELGEELIIQIAFSRKNWLLNDGYAKSAANYYRVKWQCVCGAVTNKVLAIGECLQELGYIEPDRQVSLKH